MKLSKFASSNFPYLYNQCKFILISKFIQELCNDESFIIPDIFYVLWSSLLIVIIKSFGMIKIFYVSDTKVIDIVANKIFVT